MAKSKLIKFIQPSRNTPPEDEDKKIKVLVFGKGYIGSNVSNFLSYDADNIRVYNINRQQVNYLQSGELTNFLEKCKKDGIEFDVVINAVGYTGSHNVDDAESEKDLCWHLNVTFPSMLAKVVNDFKIKKLIHISSGCIFDKGNKAWTEFDVPNFGMFDDASSFYSRSKHACELLLSHTYNNVYNIRIRMPLGEIVSNRNLLQKLLKYEAWLNCDNSVTYIYDLFNFVYNTIITDDIQFGLYNVVSGGTFRAEVFYEIALKHERDLIKAKLVKPYHLKNVEILDYPEFLDRELTVANRSNAILSNNIAVAALGAEFHNISDTTFLEKTLIRLIENASTIVKL